MSEQLIHELVNYSRSLDLVRRMPIQLNETQAEHLLNEFPIADIKKMLEAMNNWRGILNRRSVYATILNWFERDIKKGIYSKPPHPNMEPVTEIPKESFLAEHPIGSQITAGTKTYEVVSEDFLKNLKTGAVMTITHFIHNFMRKQ